VVAVSFFALGDKRYGLALMIDVIEHFHRETGLRILDRILAVSDHLLVATPWDIGDPDINHDHPFEDHKYQWLKRDFARYPNHRFIFNRSSLIVLIGKDAAKVDAVARKMSGRFYKTMYEFARRASGLKQG
jgi:hypothetical protein